MTPVASSPHGGWSSLLEGHISGVTPLQILIICAALFLLVIVTGIVKRWVVNSLFKRIGIDPGTGQAFGTIGRYIIILIGSILILRTGGVDLQSLAMLAGAFSLGLGFGLQNIIHNFVSGLIILVERPIKLGDRIEVGSIVGRVVRISFRSTLVITNDNINMIVPNSEFISTTVTNWTQTDRDVRFAIPVGVSYDADPRQVEACLLEVATTHEGVLKDPAPDVLLTSFGDSAILFELRVWTRAMTDTPMILRSDLNFAIHAKFKERGIQIPFPQRVVHFPKEAKES